MTIHFIQPLSNGWERMKRNLFQPFKLNTWLAVGFTAFLAGLLDGGNGNGGSGGNKGGDFNFEKFLDFPYDAWEWLLNNPGWSMLILFGLFMLVVIYVVLTWVSSRGKFMFLDNVLHERALIAQPWRQYKDLANSLFLWRVVFSFICFVLVIGFLYNVWKTLNYMYFEHSPYHIPVLFIMQMAAVFIAMVAVLSYISLLLNDFVIPIMYKNNYSAMKAWRFFLNIHWKHFLHFILYAIFILILFIGIVLAVIMFGCLTCCVGFLLLALPYIGSVVTLPISYTLRAFSFEFLAQFGDEYNLHPLKVE